ncbi:MAG: S8 family serine peptidase, partial [Thermoanaerobaculia bacterium]
REKKVESLAHFKGEWKINLKEHSPCFRYLKVEEKELKTHRICLSQEELLKFAEREEVAYIEGDWNITLRNDITSWVIQSNEQNSYPYWDAGLKGEGEIIGHIDSPIYLDSCYFRDEENPVGPEHRKIVAYRSPTMTDKEAHGTHTAGTAAGYAEGEPNNGIAPSAKISHTNIIYIKGIGGGDSNLYDYLELAHQDGARVHTNSWGDDSTTQYTTLCYDIDKFSYDYPEDLVLFSVTNYERLKTPENAKNLLAIGATHQAPNQDMICSGGKGPTIDGRIKPEIFAPGCNINSASVLSPCATIKFSGTSMASPAVAGASAIVREYLKKNYFRSIQQPSSSLIKAILINSGEDLTSVQGYPNFEEGWGRVLLKKTLPLSDSQNKLFIEDLKKEEGIFEGEEKTYKIKISNSNTPLSITLVWTDPPAFPSSSQILINNLDLTLISPSGKIFKGNFIENGESREGGSYDSKNNVERVILNSPEEGYWEIKIKGTSIPLPPQNFSLVVTGDIQKSSNYFLPVLTNQKGDYGSQWQTALYIYNLSEKTQKLNLTFHNPFEYKKEVELSPYEILYLEDPLLKWFNLKNTSGCLKIEASDPLKTYIRIFNLSENGTYGQSYRGSTLTYKEGEEVYFQGLFLGNEKRTNFGISNFGDISGSVKLMLYDSYGNFLGENIINIEGKRNYQVSLKTLFPSVSILNNGFLYLKIEKGEDLLPYVSVVTNGSNDGIFIEPKKMEAGEKLLPVIVGNKNPTGYPWKTELFVFSEKSTNFEANLRIIEEGSWKDIPLSLSLQPFQTIYIEDLFSYLNLEEGSGYLTFEGDFLLYERIYSGKDISNSYGQFLSQEKLSSLKKNHYLYATIPDENFRLNLGLTNPSDEQILCNASFYKNSGEKIFEKIIGVDKRNFIFYPIKGIFPQIPFGEAVLLKLECTSNLYAYTSLVDSRTSDGSTFSDF